MKREINQVIPARIYNMGGLKVRQPLPSPEADYLDPFVLLHHAHMNFDPNEPLHKAGVGPHPHKGFAPVTFLFKGGVHHRDSRGNSKVVNGGGTQWMHAGMGIIHSERPTDVEQELIQMWINSPKKNKKDQPYYHPLTKEETPFYRSDDNKTIINVISGNILNVKGPIPTLTPINSATIYTEKDAHVSFDIPETHNAFLYLLDGCIQLNGKEITGKNFIEFKSGGSTIEFLAVEPTRMLFMSGEPIREKIVTHGPFVMNDEIEIMEAYRDYRMGKMGVLIEE